MNMLKEKSRNIQFEAFHVFKVSLHSTSCLTSRSVVCSRSVSTPRRVWRHVLSVFCSRSVSTSCHISVTASSLDWNKSVETGKYEHVTPLLKDLHWLHVPERITYLVYNCLHGTTPRYIQDVIQPVAVTSRHCLLVPATWLTIIRDWAFAVAGPPAWNSLPQFVTHCTCSVSPLENMSIPTYLHCHSRALNSSLLAL